MSSLFDKKIENMVFPEYDKDFKFRLHNDEPTVSLRAISICKRSLNRSVLAYGLQGSPKHRKN